MNRHHETNPHFLPHQQPPQPRGHPSPSPSPSQQQQQQHARPKGTDPARSRRHQQRRPADSQQQPQAHQPFPSHQQYPQPQEGAGADPAQSRPLRTVTTSPQQQHERQVRFASPPQPTPRAQSQSDAFPQQPSQLQAQQQHGLRVPEPQKTRPLTWFAAVFCVIFWVVIIVGGLIVLIVYMLFRPRSPRFDVSSVSLNAAYLDMGYLLNADVTVLANFTNPNRKVNVDFSYLVIHLYYEGTLIASRAITPFSAASMQTMFADVHMVTSQVRLPIKDSQKFAAQVQKNQIQFQLKGYFRTRSNLGTFLRYSYWLYGKCSVVVTAPPSGVLVSRSCKTKR